MEQYKLWGCGGCTDSILNCGIFHMNRNAFSNIVNVKVLNVNLSINAHRDEKILNILQSMFFHFTIYSQYL